MGFVSYSTKFFKEKLSLYESVYGNKAPKFVVHEAKVLLKLLDDIRDEGYKDSYTCIDKSCDAVNRLRSFIAANDEIPFPMNTYAASKAIPYAACEHNLENYLGLIEQKMNLPGLTLNRVPSVFYDVLSYTREIFRTSNPETAYCFLLRDTLLPYLAFKKWDIHRRLNIIPMFISRKFFHCLENNHEDLYNSIQNIIFEALDSNVETLNQLKEYLRDALDNNPGELLPVVNLIRRMLDTIPQKNITIVESGYVGTIPLLLSALDVRVDFRLFTTIPYFYDHYKGRFYTNEFQKIREFETINCQNALFKLSSVSSDGFIKVVETSDNEVRAQSFKELRAWNNLINI